jgi:membrane associated rhomboid family serine protease
MIPIRDDNPTHTTPFVTVGLIALNVLAFIYQLTLGPANELLVFRFGAIPAELFTGARSVTDAAIPPTLTLFSSMFLHGGLFHVAGNMLYLWVFGNNIEDTLGHVRFLLFYLLCGVLAAYGHALTDPTSTVPMIGASGAISGVLGAYLVLFPHARVLTIIPLGFFVHWTWVPAGLVLGLWILIQFVNGFFTLGAPGGVAWFAHIGGFFAGLLLLYLFRPRRRRPPSRSFV